MNVSCCPVVAATTLMVWYHHKSTVVAHLGCGLQVVEAYTLMNPLSFLVAID